MSFAPNKTTQVPRVKMCANGEMYRYPPRMIPGCHVTIHTTAKDDRDARVLLTQIGIPFFGKKIN